MSSSFLHPSNFFLAFLSQGIIPQCHPWLYTQSPCPHSKTTYYTNQSCLLNSFQSISFSLFLVRATFTSHELFNSFSVSQPPVLTSAVDTGNLLTQYPFQPPCDATFRKQKPLSWARLPQCGVCVATDLHHCLCDMPVTPEGPWPLKQRSQKLKL